MALSIRSEPIEKALRECLIAIEHNALYASYYSTPRARRTRFVEVRIGPHVSDAARLHREGSGGLWIQCRAPQSTGILASSVWLPKAVTDALQLPPTPVDSLNVAFTRLSEVFEPWRQSHTGNVYKRVLFEGKGRKWYPLDVLRGIAEAAAEERPLQEQWAAIAPTTVPPI